ncbi:MAG: hypothetical protein A2808_02170 [Candidatus Moranbacteria bacterium RIFCSPHIGHO2_01_FULL_55_24]|nr:MAG: hypothetical protein A2808_02170 [Candidatus Moranbacteria bacterium RIFCSPHIGHO2_01_FULL_55_24]
MTEIFSTKKFQRRDEDFACERCGETVAGNGYTNHCPSCLFSKHVDVYPGDRLATCQGLMRPAEIELSQNEYRILHQCLECGYTKKNKISEQDDMEAVIRLAKDSASRAVQA